MSTKRAVADLADLTDVEPDYLGGGIVNLMASIQAATGAESRYPPLASFDARALEGARHLVLLVVDGLGHDLLSSAPAAATLNRYLRGSMTSVFPPTTAAAVTTFLTGLAPQQHGLTGWFMYLRRLGSVVSVLPFATRLGAVPLRSLGISPAELLDSRPVFERIRWDCHSVSPGDIAHSAFNGAYSAGAQVHPYEGLDALFSSIEHVVKRAAAPSFVYAYWPRLDQLAHLHGIAHPEVAAHLHAFDARLERFLDAVRGTDTLLVLTADHGFVDIPPGGEVHLSDHPRLGETLLLPLCGEPRAAYCYVVPSREADFVSYVTNELADQVHCVPSAELLENGWFGPGPPHPELATRIGDYTLLMRDGCAIFDRLPGERRSGTVGVHGGITAAELRVPLVIVRP